MTGLVIARDSTVARNTAHQAPAGGPPEQASVAADTADWGALSTGAATPNPGDLRKEIITKVGGEIEGQEVATEGLSSMVVGATTARATGEDNSPHQSEGKFKGELDPDKVERVSGPSWWALLAQAGYRVAGTPYSMPQEKTSGVDVGTNELPKALKAAPEIRLGDNTGPVSVGFPLKDDDKVYVAEARIVAADGKTILDRAKPTGAPGEFVFGGSDTMYPSGSFLVYKLSDNSSFHMPLREASTT